MPTRSLGSALIRWPDKVTVDEAFHRWAAERAATHPEIQHIGYIGSYARGDWGVGSDLDVIIVVSTSDEPFGRRLLDQNDDDLPVPADLLVYTEAELTRMRSEGRRFTKELDHVAVWAKLDKANRTT